MHRLSGGAGPLHHRPWPTPAIAAVWFLDVERPALVLGSTQAAPGVGLSVDVVRRRSGGGAVLVSAESVVWADVLVPAGDVLWRQDVGKAFRWLGDAWVAALAAAGVPAAEWHRGPLVRSPLADAVCFAGLGPGEVMLDGRKVVGISQRRTREGAMFQCAALLAWDAAGTAAAVSVPVREVADVAAAIPADRSVLEAAFLGVLATR